jgi:hypothetical protein
MNISFEVSTVLKRTDVHWVEEELLRVWEAVFLEALNGKGSEILRGLMKEGARVRRVLERKRIVEAMSYARNNLGWIENIPKMKG